jgi:hypothetical protein
MLRLVIRVSLVSAVLTSTAWAQQRPLVTEDPETVGAGRVLLETGFDYGSGQLFPASGLRGDLLRMPLIGTSVGLSSIAELQIDGGLRNRLSISERNAAPLSSMVDVTGDSTSSVEDIVVATKIRVMAETAVRPSFGVRFATKLPNASNESGLGLDTTDFFVSALIGKTAQSIRWVGNVGLSILGDPTRGDQQNDVLTYGASVARAVAEGLELVGEINGWVDTRKGAAPPGTDSRGQVRVGGRYTRGSGRVDAAVLFGVADRDPSLGFAAGYTYVFNAFSVP